MILLLDTSTPIARLTLVEGEKRYESEWKAGRELAKGLLGYMESELTNHQKTFSDIRAIGAFKGPGSFTGLRIGLTVLNTLADVLDVPIVGAVGVTWQETTLDRLACGENEQIVLPFYASDAHITQPRK